MQRWPRKNRQISPPDSSSLQEEVYSTPAAGPSDAFAMQQVQESEGLVNADREDGCLEEGRTPAEEKEKGNLAKKHVATWYRKELCLTKVPTI
ncbi:hypothetical protein FRB90_011091 [Tulasnella sp. 427]|nr:hypothetical protein FRB90_011091 [Tulasnella sp. 427]